MSNPEGNPQRQGAGWIEALHEAIASDSEYCPGPSDTPPPDEFNRVHDCLLQLESVRRGRGDGRHMLNRIGRFEIVRELGRGGFGVVLLAIDARVGRRVALKIPRPEALVDSPARRRFLREARAAGALSHPNLIRVHEVGEDGPICYIASEFCSGPNLSQWLAARSKPADEREAARLVEALARGVEHAHRRGVLHRDIKPSNVLLDPLGEVPPSEVVPSLDHFTPRLTDFGLAKFPELAEDHTRSGTLLGTPAYMAPEQAESRSSDVGPATDVYALGVVLFELLTGRPPLKGESEVQTLQLVARGDVPRPARFRPGISRDLEAIVLKCLGREPARRYASAGQLADDLGRFIAGEPTMARPAQFLEKLWKTVRRRPAAAGMAAVVCITSTVLVTGGWWYLAGMRAAQGEVAGRRLETEQVRYASSMIVAERALQNNAPSEAKTELARWIPSEESPDLRSVAWYGLWNQLYEPHRTLTGHTGDVYCARFSHDAHWLATGSQDRTVRIWDASTDKCLYVLEGHKGEVNCVAFSPLSKVVASGGDDGKICVWQTDDGRPHWVCSAHQGSVFGMKFARNILATCGSDHQVKLWDITAKQHRATLEGHTAAVQGLDVSTSGRWLATASDDSTVRVWHVNGKVLKWRLPHDAGVNSVAFSGDESQLLSSELTNGIVKLWDLRSGELIKVVSRHADRIHAVCFADPLHCAVATRDGTVVVIRIADGRIVRRFLGHEGRVWSLDMTSDLSQLVTAGSDRTVRIWQMDSQHGARVTSSPVVALDASFDGRLAAARCDNAHLHAFDVATQKCIWNEAFDCSVIGDFDGDGQADPGYFSNGVWRLSLSSRRSEADFEQTLNFGDGDDVPVVGDWDGDGRDNLGYYSLGDCEWGFDLDGQGGKAERTFTLVSHENCVPMVGRWEDPQRDSAGLASFDVQRSTWKLWFQRADAVAEVEVPDARHDWTPIAGRWHAGRPDGWGFMNETGRWVSPLPANLSDAPGRPSVVRPPASFATPDLAPLEPVAMEAARDASLPAFSRPLAVSPQGDRLAVSFAARKRFTVWNLVNSRRVATPPVGSIVQSLEYSPDGNTLLAGAENGEIVFFDGRTNARLRVVRAHRDAVRQIVYSRDGRLFVTLAGAELKIWDPDGNLLTRIDDESLAANHGLAISPAGDLLAASDLQKINIWSVPSGRLLTSLASGAHSLAFSLDQRCLATGSPVGSIRLWDLATWQELFPVFTGLPIQAHLTVTPRGLISAGGTPCEVHFFSLGQPAASDCCP